ncbi:MAG: dTMP kinase, partial [Burkholderiaceae bacterium]
MTERGRFITFEGIDGAGKSTHIETIADVLRERGIPFVATREPGGTRLGEQLRELILAKPMTPMTETLLIFAARSEHVARIIQPALRGG